MDCYLPTGNEMVSLPKINELTAGIEDLTFLSMQHKGMIEVRGGSDTPLIQPFIRIGETELPLTDLQWSRDSYWIPALQANAGSSRFGMMMCMCSLLRRPVPAFSCVNFGA